MNCKTPKLHKILVFVLVASLIFLLEVYDFSGQFPRSQELSSEVLTSWEEKSALLAQTPLACLWTAYESMDDISRSPPTPGNGIFLLETSCDSFKDGKIVTTPKKACAVESAALHHPQREVYFLFTSPGVIKFQGDESDEVLNSILSYKNVNVLHLSLEGLFDESLVKNIWTSGRLNESDYPVEHLGDVLRFLLLWKYGGMYLDTDLIVLRNLDVLGDNFVGKQSKNDFGSSAVAFSSEGEGHNYVEMILRDLGSLSYEKSLANYSNSAIKRYFFYFEFSIRNLHLNYY